jgi:hypothetical protein
MKPILLPDGWVSFRERKWVNSGERRRPECPQDPGYIHDTYISAQFFERLELFEFRLKNGFLFSG